MFETIISTLKEVWSKKYSILPQDIRLGTKIAICLVVFNCILIVWLLVGIPLLTIYYPGLNVYAANLANIIIALIGGATATYTTSEVRKTIENTKTVTRETDENHPSDENPKPPFKETN